MKTKPTPGTRAVRLAHHGPRPAAPAADHSAAHPEPARAARTAPAPIAMIQCDQLEKALVEGLDRNALTPPLRAHLEGCAECTAMLADFNAIAGRVRLLALTEPVPDLWPEIRERLRREGVIHAPRTGPTGPHPQLVRRARPGAPRHD